MLWGIYFYYLSTIAIVGWVAGIAILAVAIVMIGLTVVASIIQSQSDGEDPDSLFFIIEWAFRLSNPVAAIRVILGALMGLPMTVPMAWMMVAISGVALLTSYVGFLDKPELRRWLGLVFGPFLLCAAGFALLTGWIIVGLILFLIGLYMLSKYANLWPKGKGQ